MENPTTLIFFTAIYSYLLHEAKFKGRKLKRGYYLNVALTNIHTHFHPQYYAINLTI